MSQCRAPAQPKSNVRKTMDTSGPRVVSGAGVGEGLSEDAIERRISERDQAIERIARLNGIETIRSDETTVLLHFARWRPFD